MDYFGSTASPENVGSNSNKPTMKQIIHIFLTLVILTSCSNQQTSNVNIETKEVDDLKEKFSEVFNGVWVLTDYIKSIESTKSPLKSAEKFDGVVTMIIDIKNQVDSLFVGVSWNNHEGDNFTVYSISGNLENSLKTNLIDYENKSNYYELGYENISNQTYLALYHYNKDNKLIDKKLFSKVADKQTDDDAAWGLQYIVNEKLFKGDYTLIDSSDNKTNVSFKSDGILIGMPEFKSYYVFTDFMGGPETILDGIAFKANEQTSTWFAFEIKKDTTFLYNTKGDEEAGELLQLDKLIYKLVRK